ncbi:MAG: hypothetical protein ACLQPH_15550 [Acidimicrobiales bacterium]
MGIPLAPPSVWAVLRRHGLDPSPNRRGPTWGEFLKSQATSMLACDFFTVDTVQLRRLYVLFFVKLDTRTVFVTRITEHPTGPRVAQQARNLAYDLAERAQPVKFLIRDRDTRFTSSFDEILRTGKVVLMSAPLAR